MSIADELLKLKELLDSGILSQEEFDSQKQKLITGQCNTSQAEEQEVESDNSPQRKVGIGLGAGILFLPYIFSWFTLRKGHTKKAKVIAFAWLCWCVVWQIGNLQKPGDKEPDDKGEYSKRVLQNREIDGYTDCIEESRRMGQTSISDATRYCCEAVYGTWREGTLGLPTCEKVEWKSAPSSTAPEIHF